MAKEKGYQKRVDSSTESVDLMTGFKNEEDNLLYGKRNYRLILIGLGLIFLGLFLMSGGHMPSPDVWDESLIYSPVRITLAPIIILIGLGVNVYAVFAKK